VKKNIPGKCRRNQLESFTGKNITRFGGAGLVRRFFDKLGIADFMAVLGTEKRRKDDYSPADMCLSMLYGLMMGIFRPSHMMELAADKVFQRIARLGCFPSQSTISRFLAKITVHKADHLAGINYVLLDRVRKGFQDMKKITLDLDSHVIPVFGNQHRAKRGYNPKKRGRKSYHPLLCFVGESRDCLGGLLRPGNCTNHHVRDFLKKMFLKLPDKAEVRLRADSGFFNWDFLKWLWRRGIEFYVVVPQQPWVQRLILGIGTWHEIDGNRAAGEMLVPISRNKQVRFVVIRKTVKRGEVPRKQLKLLSVQEELYDYQVIATNSALSGEDVWHCYNQRACCENFIKEGIYDFGLDTSVTKNWAGSRLYFELVMLAYNLMNWFKEMALGHSGRKEMAWTVRWKLFWIPARLVTRGRRIMVRLAQWWTYQNEFRHAQSALM
jgi:transposase